MGQRKTFFEMVLNYMNNQSVDVDLNEPIVKASLQYVYPLFIMLHACVCIVGTVGNSALLITIWRRRLYRNPTMVLMANLALADLIKSTIVLPITSASLILASWMFGSFLCYLMPMMQSLLTYASMWTYFVMALDRYRRIAYPMKSRIPLMLCIMGVWVVSICVVLPYAVYINYHDLGSLLGPSFSGVGICWLSMETRIEEYIRAMFVAMYCLPLAIIAFLYVRVSGDLKPTDQLSIHFEDNRRSESTVTYNTAINLSSSGSEHRIGPDSISVGLSDDGTHVQTYRTRRSSNATSVDDDGSMDELDLRKERRTQRYLIAMVLIFALCWCPINILTLVSHFVLETDQNSSHLDVTYLTFTFFGFLSSCVNPVIFASWYMSNQTKDKLRGYFRFSNRFKQDHIKKSANSEPLTHSESHGLETVVQAVQGGHHSDTSRHSAHDGFNTRIQQSDVTWNTLSQCKKCVPPLKAI